MSERPILFSAPMVRALLEGRKTQTRRVMKHQPSEHPTVYQASLTKSRSKPVTVAAWLPVFNEGECCICPYGNVGDRLWVRETWGYRVGCNIDTQYQQAVIEYNADMKQLTLDIPPGGQDKLPKQRPCGKGEDYRTYYDDYLTRYWQQWRPSIFMPRWASRITLEITGVRVERLQDISEADAITEGIERHPTNGYWIGGPHPTDGGSKYHADPRLAYRGLWDSINSNRPTLPHNPASERYARVKKWLDTHPDTTSWDANPWVWVIEFKSGMDAA